MRACFVAMTKICCKCKITKSLESFYLSKRRVDGLDELCRICKSTKRKEYYQKNKTKEAERDRVWRINNPEKILENNTRGNTIISLLRIQDKLKSEDL